jgi:hypothetical protein
MCDMLHAKGLGYAVIAIYLQSKEPLPASELAQDYIGRCT